MGIIYSVDRSIPLYKIDRKSVEKRVIFLDTHALFVTYPEPMIHNVLKDPGQGKRYLSGLSAELFAGTAGKLPFKKMSLFLSLPYLYVRCIIKKQIKDPQSARLFADRDM